jgi:hypothetical protein
MPRLFARNRANGWGAFFGAGYGIDFTSSANPFISSEIPRNAKRRLARCLRQTPFGICSVL